MKAMLVMFPGFRSHLCLIYLQVRISTASRHHVLLTSSYVKLRAFAFSAEHEVSFILSLYPNGYSVVKTTEVL